MYFMVTFVVCIFVTFIMVMSVTLVMFFAVTNEVGENSMKEFYGVLNLVEGFTADEKKRLVKKIMAMMESPSPEKKVNRAISELRGERPDCPHCRTQSELGFIVKRGVNRNGAQRYYCKKCGKIFVATTKTAFENTRKSADVWNKYIELTISGASLMRCAEECCISYQTAFIWRHKVLNVFKVNQEHTEMTGLVEMDEMLIPVSYKGNRVKGAIGTKRVRKHGEENGLPRRSYRRGTDNRSNQPKSKACVVCMVENGNKAFWSAVPGTGFLNEQMLAKTIGTHVNKESGMVLVDQNKVTQKFLENNQYRFVALASNTSDNYKEHKPEIQGENRQLHLQHVNAMHRHIRRFLQRYCGVSTKYLENYISLYVWIKTTQEKRMARRLQSASVARAAISDCYISRRALCELPAVPVCA